MNNDTEPDADLTVHESNDQTHAAVVSSSDDMPKVAEAPVRKKRFGSKRMVIAGTVAVIVVAALMGVPFLRYGIAGIFVTKQVVLTVVDSANNKPVSGADVVMGRFGGSTDAKGKVVVNSVPVGSYTVDVSKKNYKALRSTHTVPIISSSKESTMKIQATGRTVTLTVTNNINGKAIPGANVNIEGATAVSDEKGIANVVLPVQQAEQTGTVQADSYNKAAITVQMKTNDDQALNVKLTPAGKIYFLSKRTGTINVMSSDLDGANQTVVVAGTGREVDNETSLLPSPDWTSMVLIARRDPDGEKLYSVSPAGQLKLIQDDDVSYQPIGWVAHRFYYKVTYRQQSRWANKADVVMSYDADSGSRDEVDSTVGTGSSYYDMAAQYISSPAIIGGKVVYVKYWNYGPNVTDKTHPSGVTVVDGTIKTTLKDIPAVGDVYADSMLKKPGMFVIRLGHPDGSKEYYQYTGGKVTASTVDDTAFYNNRISYQMSPDRSKAFWSEQRDGKAVAFEASGDLNDATQVSSADYTPYGWFTNDYVLYSKNTNELYISPAGSQLDGAHKVTDYHKAVGYEGYGWGAGGAAY